MRPINIKKLNHKDQVARRHHRIFILKIVVSMAMIVMFMIGLVYLLFFSRLFNIKEVSFNGLDTVSSDEFRVKINDNLNQKILKYLPRKNNIFFVNTDNFETEFASTYPIFKSVNVRKKLPHGLIFDFLERKPSGVWCFKNDSSALLVSNCSYFDNDKVLWGQSAKSSGFIFLTIEDQREKAKQQIDDEFFESIMEVAKNLSGKVKNIIIPANSFNEFWVYTADYYIIFSIDSDIQNQLDILKIFINDKNKDFPPASGFYPQYIDLRIDGRVYYK